MSTEKRTEGAAGTRSCEDKGKWGDHQFNKEDVKQIWTIWKECKEESFWYRALPLSLGSMGVTGGLIYNGIWKSSARFGPFPKLAVAGILGFAVGKASYLPTCRSKFQDKFGPEFGPWAGRPGPGFGPGFGPGSGHRHCRHVCHECKKQAETAPAPAEKV